MKDFVRNDRLLSLCGLNCGLCVMHLDDYCPGCGGGPGNQSCGIAKCSRRTADVEYCWQCEEYPCEKYDGIDEFDSFIIHRNQLKDFEKVKKIGLAAYHSELNEKAGILKYLLANYNDGRRKSFFSMAVNLLELEDVEAIMKQMDFGSKEDNRELKEKAAYAAGLFQAMADRRGIILKLNRKPGKRAASSKKVR